jgi:hypothetical protein
LAKDSNEEELQYSKVTKKMSKSFLKIQNKYSPPDLAKKKSSKLPGFTSGLSVDISEVL